MAEANLNPADTSKNSIICHSCANDVNDEYVACQGFCNAVFHLQCCGSSPELLKDIASHRQIFWLCKSCSNLMVDLRHRRSVQCAFEAGQELSLSHHNRIVEQLKSEILSELKSEISSNFAKLISSNSLTPRSGNGRPGGSVITAGRRIFGTNPPPGTALNPGPQPAGNDIPSAREELVAGTEVPRFWLYLSRVSRWVTEEQINKLAVDCLGNNDIKVFRLVAKDQDISRMKFISFKIGMQPSLRAIALSPSTWPRGLLVREFVERSGEIFWEPPNAANPTQRPPSAPFLTPQPISTPKNTPMSTGSSPQEQQLD